MPTETSVIGVSIVPAIQIADPINDEWGDEKVLGARDAHLIKSDDLDSERELHIDDSLGRTSASGADTGNESVTGSITEFLRHITSEKLIAMVMGESLVDFQGPISVASTADGGTTTTLVDSGQTWTVDEWAGYYVVTGHTGTGGEQVRQIVSNTATELTVATWTAPAATFPTYQISKFAPQTKSTATSGGAATLDDTGQTWTVDALIGKWVRLTGGLGSGQVRRITDNTGTQITVAENWTTTPDATTTYEVSNQAAQKTYTWADSLLAIFATYGKNKSDAFTEIFASIKATGAVISGDFGSPLELVTALIASGRSHDSSINTTSTFNNVTHVETGNRVIFDENAVIMINTASGGALAPAVGATPNDQIYPTAINIGLERPMAGVHGAGSGISIDEPTIEAIPKPIIGFTIGRVRNANFFNDFASNVSKKMQVEFVGQSITLDGSATQSRSAKLEFPHIEFSSVPSSTSEGIATIEVEANVFNALTAPTGMDTTDPVRVTFINDHAGDLLQIGNQ